MLGGPLALIFGPVLYIFLAALSLSQFKVRPQHPLAGRCDSIAALAEPDGTAPAPHPLLF